VTMDMTDLERAFVEVTRRYLIEHSEACLVEAAEIGRRAVLKDTPIENMADVFEAALVELVREFPSRALKDAVGVVSPLLAEVLIGFGLAFRENQARLEADALLYDQFNFLNAMIEAMPAPVFYKNREGVLLGHNKRFSNFMHCPEGLLVGQRVADIEPRESASMYQQFDNIVYTTRKPQTHDYTRAMPDGTEHSLRIYQAPFDKADGTLGGLIGIIIDITADMRREEELRKASEAAKAANRAKSSFLSTMSHELRTPLNAVMGYAELLLSSEPEPNRKAQLGIIKEAGGSLLQIINNILDISKIESGKAYVSETDFLLSDVMESVSDMFSGEAVDKRITLKTSVDASVPPCIHSDPGLLKQVLVNLVGNALKFTESGGVDIHVSVTPSSRGKDLLRFEITDTGIGIQPHNIERVFEPFEQEDGSFTRKFGGTGLGLAITKKLVTLVGGEIGVHSTPSIGSVFWFTFPFDASNEATRRARRTLGVDPTGASGRSLSILVAEDNRINQMLMRTMLHKLGHAVCVVGDGRQALDAVMSGSFDIVLMDILMPEMDGVEATLAIRALPLPKGRVPILALSADVMPERVDVYLRAGIDGVIPKPVDWQVLSAALATHTE